MNSVTSFSAKLAFLTIAVFGTFLAQDSAQACSDLPNICEQQRLHHEEMIQMSIQQQMRQQQMQQQQMQQNSSPAPTYPGSTGTRNHSSYLAPILIQLGLQRELAEKQNSIAELKQAFESQYGKILFEGKQGWWIMPHKERVHTKGCVATFLPPSGSTISFFGADELLPGAILFQGSSIPLASETKEVRVVLSTNDTKPTNVRAFQVTIAIGSPAILIPTNMMKTMQGTTEATWITLQLDGKEIFRSDMAGVMVARDAMLKCMRAE